MLISGLLFIILGFLIGSIIFNNKIEFLKKIRKTDTYYFLQEGVYKDKDILNNNLSSLNNKVIELEEDEYHVYLGITKDIDVVEKLINIYENEGYKVFPTKKNFSSTAFSHNLDQFDLLIKETDEEDKILTIENIVLANYNEIIKNSSKIF